MHQSSFSSFDFNHSTTFTVPSTEGPSSSLVSKKAIENRGWASCRKNSSVATTMAAKEVFMSLAPRPNNLPSRWLGVKGSVVHLSKGPVGTTSVWPANTKVGPFGEQRLIAHRLLTLKLSGPKFKRCESKSKAFKRSPKISRHPASSGLTEGEQSVAQSTRGWQTSQSRKRSFKLVFARV